MLGSSTAKSNPPPISGVRMLSMTETDLDQVLQIERVSFSSPWRREHFLFEIRNNPRAVSSVVKKKNLVMAYSCVWHLYDELKINNIAVHPDCRNCGLGRWLLLSVLGQASSRGCRVAKLEVRPSNRAAIRLYRSEGFIEIGRRKGYYQQENEDAILMELKLVVC